MNRLTWHEKNGEWGVTGVTEHELRRISDTNNKLYAALWRLCCYENTGLEPKQLREMDEEYQRMCKKLHELESKTPMSDFKRVYISGAISGTDDYMERFAKAEEKLTAYGYTVVNPAKLNAVMPKDADYEEYMTMCFKLLDMCGSIFMLKGWEKSCGANRELGYAKAKDDMVIMRE